MGARVGPHHEVRDVARSGRGELGHGGRQHGLTCAQRRLVVVVEQDGVLADRVLAVVEVELLDAGLVA